MKFVYCITFVLLIYVINFFYEDKEKKVHFIRADVSDISRKIRTPGKITNKNKIKIKSQLSGTLKEVYVSVGDEVSLGSKIFSVLPDSKDSEYRKIYKKIKWLEGVKSIKEINYLRYKKLYLKGAIPESELLDYELYYQEAIYNLSIAEEELSFIRSETDKRNVISPVTGKVVDLLVNQNELVSTGEHVLTIAANDSYTIEAKIDISNLAYITDKHNVTISSDTNRSGKWLEKISIILPTVEDNYFLIETTFTEGLFRRFFLNQQVDLTLSIDESKEAIVLPRSAIQNNEKGKTIIVAKPVIQKKSKIFNKNQRLNDYYCMYLSCYKKESHKIEYVSIITGIENFDKVEILKGIKVTDIIVVDSTEIFNEGDIVELITND